MSTENEAEVATGESTTAPSTPVDGCYLVYEADSGGKLTLYYSKTPVEHAVGFWYAGQGKKIQGFKYKQNGGRSELIRGIMGGDANRKKYFSGWCQFIKAAKAFKGSVVKFPNEGPGVEVDIYGYNKDDTGPTLLNLDDGACDVSELEGVVVLPKHNDTYTGVKSMTVQAFLTKGSAGAASAC